MAYVSLNVTFGQEKIVDDIDLPIGKDDTPVGPACHMKAGANEVGHTP